MIDSTCVVSVVEQRVITVVSSGHIEISGFVVRRVRAKRKVGTKEEIKRQEAECERSVRLNGSIHMEICTPMRVSGFDNKTCTRVLKLWSPWGLLETCLLETCTDVPHDQPLKSLVLGGHSRSTCRFQ